VLLEAQATGQEGVADEPEGEVVAAVEVEAAEAAHVLEVVAVGAEEGVVLLGDVVERALERATRRWLGPRQRASGPVAVSARGRRLGARARPRRRIIPAACRRR
jgi:hypothetical protein